MEGEIVENIPRAGEKFFTKQFTSENIYAIMYLVKIGVSWTFVNLHRYNRKKIII